MKKNAMCDFHSHVLPGVDDGSRSVDESLKMLEMLKDQGVSVVVATPHFDADRISIEHFLKRRRRAYDRVMEAAPDDIPQIRLGAEVLYYPGISRLEGLGDLCIEGTRLLLLEMPLSKWDKYAKDELINMAALCGVVPVVAHVERCLPFQDRNFFDEFRTADVLFQVNASFLINRSTRMRALRLLKKGLIQFIGSDCHGAVSRPPELGEAYRIVAKKLGEDFLLGLFNFEDLDIKQSEMRFSEK